MSIVHSKNMIHLILLWEVLMDADTTEQEWRYVRHEISKAIKQIILRATERRN